MLTEITKLDNRLKDVKSIFESLEFLGSNSDMSANFYQLERDFFSKYVERKHDKSFWGWYGTETECETWHVDMNNETHREFDMLLCAYPSPTLILDMPNQDHFACPYNSKLNTQHDIHDSVENLIKTQKLRVIEPKPGDVYYLPASTIHRINPKDIGVKHLCLRTYKPLLKKEWINVHKTTNI